MSDDATNAATGGVEMLDIMDNEPVDQDDPAIALPGNVVIRVPTIYVNASVEGDARDESIENLRLIDESVLMEIMTVAFDVASATHDRSIEIWKTLVQMLMRFGARSTSSESQVLNFLNYISEFGKDLDVDDDYIDVESRAINFDVQRVYANDPSTGLLIGYTDVPGALLYSQLANEESVAAARRANNDTRLNRAYYCLERFERTLKFEPGFVLDKTIKMANLALVHLCLVSASRPLRYMSGNDIKSNMLGYIIDLVIRSRVIQAWQRNESSRRLMADLVRNYDSRHVMVNLCRMTSARDRAKYVLQQFSTIERLQELVKCLSYDEYERLLERTVVEINGQRYYVFDHRFLVSIAALQSFAAMRRVYRDSPGDDPRDDADGGIIGELLGDKQQRDRRR